MPRFLRCGPEAPKGRPTSIPECTTALFTVLKLATGKVVDPYWTCRTQRDPHLRAVTSNGVIPHRVVQLHR